PPGSTKGMAPGVDLPALIGLGSGGGCNAGALPGAGRPPAAVEEGCELDVAESVAGVWVAAQPLSSRDKRPTCNMRTGLNIIILMETVYITHPSCRLHEMGGGHPERPARLDAINDQLLASGLMNLIGHRQAQPAARA